MVSDGVRGLVTGPDGADLLLRAASWDPAVRPGGVLGAGCDPAGLPFGLVELVVEAGLGAGSVHRLGVGTYRCGPGAWDDVPLPSQESWTLDVGLGGAVAVEVGGERMPWRLGELRRVAGLDLRVRWCRGPARPGGSARGVRGRSLADVLLDRVDGLVVPTQEPAWELGRPGGRPADGPGGWTSVPLSEEPVLVVGGRFARAYARGVLGRMLASDPRLRLTLLAPGLDTELREAWAWLRWLPQARCGDDRFVRVGFDDDSCARWSADLVARVGASTRDVLDLVVVDGRVEDAAALARPGLAALVLDDAAARQAFAAGTGEVLAVDVPGPRARLVGLGSTPLDLEVDLPERGWADRLARTLTRTEPEPATTGRLLDLLDVDPHSEASIARRWEEPPTTRVVVGLDPDADDAPVTVDLAADGPHTLVGGTTGAGKSELLQTLVTSLALANPPEAISFLLVDYKGGAAFAACEGLPHTVGVVTDLDAGLTQRALASLAAEVHRRERLLAEVGAVDLASYLAAGHGPLARLVIVVDEFATLAAELPDFVDGLVDIARRGRSLGLHLVLATQRPAGAVSADIRANTTLRIALRVVEAADSVDVIGLPDAVALPDAHPGRALVRVGQNPPVLLQTARVTTAAPSAEATLTPYEFGRPLGVPVTPDGRPRSDLAALAATMRAHVECAGLPLPTRPWLPPLPPSVDLAVCEAQAAAESHDGGRRVVFGLEDRPDRQCRAAAVLDLDRGVPLAVVGGSRSGRSAMLGTLAAAVAATFTPTDVHVYAIDAGTHGLAGLEGLPHVGVVVGRDDPGRVERLVGRLVGELDRRLQHVAVRHRRDAGGLAAEESADTWPTVLLLVDRWDALTDAAEASDDRSVLAGLERLATEGGRVGIVVVATGDRTLLTGRLTSVFPDRLVLRLADAHDYLAIGLPGPAGHGEPGRGWRGADAVETQVADTEDLLGLLRSLPGGLGGEVVGGPFRIDPLPGYVTRADVDELADGGSAGGGTGAGAPALRGLPGGADRRGSGGEGGASVLRLVPPSPGGGRPSLVDDPPAGGARPTWWGRGTTGPDAHAAERAGGVGDDRVIPLRPWLGRSGDTRDDEGPDRAQDDPWALPPGPQVTPRSGALLVAVGGDEVGPLFLDAEEHGPCALVTGRRRSGRSGVLLTLVESALAEDWEVVVVTARRSPLLEVPARTRGRVHGPVRRDEDAERMLAIVREGIAAGRRVLVVADDVDLVPDGDLLDALAELPVLFRDSGSLFVGSGEAEEIVGAYRGPCPMLRRARSGVMLAPQGAEDGEAFGVRLRRSQYGRSLAVGAGYLVLDGLPERAQVIRSSFFPEL